MATFTQIIGETTYIITVPNNRVETVVDKIDFYVEKGKLDKAIAIAEQFVGKPEEVRAKREPVENRGERAAAIIDANKDKGRSVVIKLMMEALNITYANAFYYAKKAGV